MFARRGFAGTKTSLIAVEAGVSEGLIYRYFKSKDELYTVLVRELIEEATKELDHIHLLPGTPYEQMKALTQAMLAESSKSSFLLILRARKEVEIPEEARQVLEQHAANALIDRLVPIFIKGQQAGDFSEGDPQKLLSWYFNIINSLIMQEIEKEAYGIPDTDRLMRFLSK